jgi:hypothetical protein
MSRDWWANKLGRAPEPAGPSTLPPAAPYHPGQAPGTPTYPPQPTPQAPAPQGQQFSTDNQGVRQLIGAVGQQGPWEIVLANNWKGGEGAEETARIGQCPKCGSPRYSGHGDRVFNTKTQQFATPALRCMDCGHNSAGREQVWNAPRRAG